MKSNQIRRLLTPSWLVTFIGLAAGILTTAAVIILNVYQSSELRFQIFDVQSRNIVDQQQGIYANITLETEKIGFLGSLPLLITWACIGFVVYLFAMAIANSFGRAASLKEQMNYVNASRQQLIRDAFARLAIRLMATLGWFLCIKLTIAVLVPYALASAAAAAAGFMLQSVGYAILAVAVIYATVVIHAVFLRLILLKPRVFGN